MPLRGWEDDRWGSRTPHLSPPPSPNSWGRIRSLSGALDDLYRDFSSLKEQLGRLSARFAEVEAFVDQLSRTRGPGAPPRHRGLPQPARRPPDTPQ